MCLNSTPSRGRGRGLIKEEKNKRKREVKKTNPAHDRDLAEREENSKVCKDQANLKPIARKRGSISGGGV